MPSRLGPWPSLGALAATAHRGTPPDAPGARDVLAIAESSHVTEFVHSNDPSTYVVRPRTVRLLLHDAHTEGEDHPMLDGSHDFDWELGVWTTHLRVLHNPLSPDATWQEYDGTSVVHALCNGRANVVELDVAGASGMIRGLSLRLYHVEVQQWSLHFANARDGLLTSPSIGGFSDGRGEFYGVDTVRGRSVLARFMILDVTADAARFEQSYSADGGKTWELNWVATDTRIRRGVGG